MSNAYGDTVAFDSRRLFVSRLSYLTPHRQVQTDPMVFLIPRASTSGTPIVIVSRLPLARMSRRDLLEQVLEDWPKQLGQGPPEGSGPISWYEPGRFDHPARGVMEFGWDLHADARRTTALRMTFVVFGRPDRNLAEGGLRDSSHEPWARHRLASDPIPVRADQYLRYHAFSADEVRATARFVADVLVDLRARTIAPWDSTSATVLASAIPAGASADCKDCAVIGRVLDRELGSPVATAVISVDHTESGGVVDSTGLVRIANVECWEFVIAAGARGYATSDSVVWLRPGRPDTLVFRLQKLPDIPEASSLPGKRVPR